MPKHFHIDEVFLQLQVVLFVHLHQFYSIDLFALDVLASINSTICSVTHHIQQLILLIESIDSTSFFLFVLIRKLPHKTFRHKCIFCHLKTLASRSNLFLSSFDLQTVFGDYTHLLQRILYISDLPFSYLFGVHFIIR